MPLQAPVDRLTHQVFRTAVLHLRESERRRSFPVTVHAGLPGSTASHTCAPAPALDHGLRCDIAAALLARTARDPVARRFVWLTRPGLPSMHDVDQAWRSAVAWAAASLDVPSGLVVVTRHGWFDPESGVVREWRRLRRHGPDPAWPG